MKRFNTTIPRSHLTSGDGEFAIFVIDNLRGSSLGSGNDLTWHDADSGMHITNNCPDLILTSEPHRSYMDSGPGNPDAYSETI